MADDRWQDRALRLGWRPSAAWLGLPLFALYFAGVVGGSTAHGMNLPRTTMGWLQQGGGALAVLVGVALLPNRRTALAPSIPPRPWFAPSILVSLSITAAGWLASVAIGDKPEKHGLSYFAYHATMPVIGKELGFRGLVLGVLVASLLRPSSPAPRRLLFLVVAAAPFAALHILEQGGFALAALFAFTLYAGTMLGWLRTGSLLVAVLAHNLANVANGLLDALLVAVRP